MPPKPSVESASEGTSSASSPAARSRGATSSVATVSISETSAVAAKKSLQLPLLANSPPSTGPTLGAKPSAMPAMPMPVALRCAGKRTDA